MANDWGDEPVDGPQTWGDEPVGAEPSWRDTTIDSLKQIYAAVPRAMEARMATMPSLMGLAGRGVESLFGKGDPERVAEREKMLELVNKQRGSGISQYLPQPQTEIGRSIGNIAETALGGAGTGAGVRAGVMAGLGSEALGRAAQVVAPEAEPYMRVGGAVAGGLSGIRRTGRATQEAALAQAPEEITKGAKGLYRPLDEASPIPIDKLGEKIEFGDMMKQQLRAAGVRDFGKGETAYRALEDFAKNVHDVGDLMSWRSAMRDALYSKGMGRAAQALSGVTDQLIDRVSPSGVGLLKAADHEWSLKKLMEALSDRFDTLESQTAATSSGSNLDNKIRQALVSFKNNDRAWHGLTQQQQVQVQNMINGGLGLNGLRKVSNVLGGGGGLGSVASMLLGHQIMGPIGLAAAPIGMGLKGIENSIAAQRFRNLRGDVAAGSLFTGNLPLQAPPLAGQVARTIPFGGAAEGQQEPR